jgi:hypothetical protein
MSPIRPSYAAGFARFAAESGRPELWRGLVGAWVPALGNTGNRLLDVSGRGNHGTASGNNLWTTTRYGPSFVFNDSSNEIVIGSAPLMAFSSSTPFSVVFFANVTSLSETGYIVAKYYSGYAGWAIVQSSATLLAYGYSGASKSFLSFFAATGWHHVAIAFDGLGGVSAYKNGVLFGSQTGMSWSAATVPVLKIGNRDGTGFSSGSYWTGQLGNLQIWNRTLSQNEISLLYADPLGMFRPRRRVFGGRRQAIFRRNLSLRSGSRGVMV